MLSVPVADLVGLAGSFVSVVLWLPQARRTWRVRHDAAALAGLSAGTQWLLVLNASIWLLYAWLAHAHWVGVPGLVTLPLALGTIWLVGRSRRGRHCTGLDQTAAVTGSQSSLCSGHHLDADSPDQTCGHSMALPHKIVVVSPPGYGTVLDCNGQRRWDAVLMVPQEP